MSITVSPCLDREPHGWHDWQPEPAVIHAMKRCPGVRSDAEIREHLRRVGESRAQIDREAAEQAAHNRSEVARLTAALAAMEARALAAEAQVAELRKAGPWTEHVEKMRAMKAERDGDCICDTNPETTDGPDECCPWHGRAYSDWIDWGVTLQECVVERDATIARVREVAARGGQPGRWVLSDDEGSPGYWRTYLDDALAGESDE